MRAFYDDDDDYQRNNTPVPLIFQGAWTGDLFERPHRTEPDEQPTLIIPIDRWPTMPLVMPTAHLPQIRRRASG